VEKYDLGVYGKSEYQWVHNFIWNQVNGMLNISTQGKISDQNTDVERKISIDIRIKVFLSQINTYSV
jgi:hypothetical protein